MSVLLIDSGDLLLSLVNGLKSDRRKIIVVCRNKKILNRLNDKNCIIINKNPFAVTSYSEIDFSELSEIIVGLRYLKRAKSIIAFLNSKRKSSSQLILAHKENCNKLEEEQQIGVNKVISIPELISKDFFVELGKYNKRRNVEKMFSTIKEGDHLLIMSHDNPDPDSIASAVALKYLLKKAKNIKITIGYGGNVGRSENFNMLDLLNIKMSYLDDIDFNKISKVAMVETYPGGNNSYRWDITPSIIIDHHPHQKKYTAEFIDVRPDVGANSTILTEYFIYSRYKMNKQVATALLYAIKTDTMSFNRGISGTDIEAFSYLYDKADLNLLKKIEQPSLSPEEFETFGKAITNKKIIKKILFSNIGKVKDREIIPQIADFCLELKGVKLTVVFGRVNGSIVISVRNKDNKMDAGKLLKKAFNGMGTAGGHKFMAGAEIKLSDTGALKKNIDSIIIENITKNL